MQPPLVSVLMTVLNGVPFVSEAVASVLDQTLQELELIIVDDGSQDGTWEEVTAWAARDERIVARSNPATMGTGRALNQALALAHGEFIARQDADDCSAPERLAFQVSFLRNHPEVGALATAVILLDDEGNSLGVHQSPERNNEIQELLPDRMCLCGPSLMIRRSALQQAGFHFDEELSYSEDYDLCLRLAEVTALASLRKPLYGYRQHAGSVSRGKRPLQMLRKAVALERALQRRYAQDPPEELVRMLARDYFRAAVLAFAAGERGNALECQARALRWDPMLFDRCELVGEVIERYAPRGDAASALAFAEVILADLVPSSAARSVLMGAVKARCGGRALSAGRSRHWWKRIFGGTQEQEGSGKWSSWLRPPKMDRLSVRESKRDRGKHS